MRINRTTMSLLALLALLAAACSGGDGDAEAADDAGTEVEAEDDAEADGDDDGDAEDDGDGEAWAVWDGEEITFDRVRCDTIVENDFQIRAGGADLPELQVRFPEDGDDHAFDDPSLVAIFFDGDDGTIGDGEGYDARGDEISDVTSDGSQVAGELHLEPDDATRADEVNPDGGTIEFEMVCP